MAATSPPGEIKELFKEGKGVLFSAVRCLCTAVGALPPSLHRGGGSDLCGRRSRSPPPPTISQNLLVQARIFGGSGTHCGGGGTHGGDGPQRPHRYLPLLLWRTPEPLPSCIRAPTQRERHLDITWCVTVLKTHPQPRRLHRREDAATSYANKYTTSWPLSSY
jgi:hypothetical protein